MIKTFIGLLVVLGLAAGAFFFASPELANKTFEKNKENVEKFVTNLREKGIKINED